MPDVYYTNWLANGLVLLLSPVSSGGVTLQCLRKDFNITEDSTMRC